MAYGRIDDNGRLVRYGTKVKVNGEWVDIETAADWRTANGVKTIVDDGGASCICADGEVPVATGYTAGESAITVSYTATDIDDAPKGAVRKSVKSAIVSGMTGDEKDALLEKIAAALCAAVVLAFPIFAGVKTARLGDLKSDSVVVTNATPAYSWNRPNAWAIDVAIDAAEVAGSATIATSDTDAAGRVWTNVTYSTTYQMAAQCSPRLLDESSLDYPIISSWEALPPGGNIDEDGHFTALTSGLYRVSATAADGVVKYADVALSAERTVVTSNETAYVDDAAQYLRHGCHTNALALLNAATVATTNVYGSTRYVVWNAYTPRLVPTIAGAGAGTGDFRCFAVSAHILASASHHFPKRYTAETFTDGATTATLTKQVWHDLESWAVQNGFTATEAAAVKDLSLITCTGDSVPSACRPYFLTPEAFERRFGGDAKMLTGWLASQVSDYAIPVVFTGGKFNAWGDNRGATRRDIRQLVDEMEFATYPVHGGDSGLPIFLLDGSREIVVAHFSWAVGCAADYINGFKIIKAFVEAHGDTLKEVE